MTPGPLRPSDSPYGCSLFGFPTLSGFKPLSLPRKRTPRPVIRNGTCDPGPPPPYRQVTLVSFGWLQPFRAATVCNYLISGSFNAPPGGLFNFPSPYKCAIGLGLCLALGVNVSQIHAPVSRHATPEIGPIPLGSRLRGYHPLWRSFPEHLGFAEERETDPIHHIRAGSSPERSV